MGQNAGNHGAADLPHAGCLLLQTACNHGSQEQEHYETSAAS
jgi:hypothetical protein